MKEFIQNLTKVEKTILFILTINLLVNIIIYFISKNYQENHLSNKEFIDYFYPFVELRTEFLRGKYENTKLVASYSLLEFIIYGLFPIGAFILWLKVFKTEPKKEI